ncbi:MAG: glycerophosphodiester phosphodiesterase family protein [Polyangiales bacterium]
MDAWRSLQGPLLYAHRGARLEHPENSLQAFEAALALGADALEIDVHMTRDGHVVIAHDASAWRMAAVAREIRACALSEVRSWDISRGFTGGSRNGAVRMPTLHEALEGFPDGLFNVDVKQREPDMLASLLATIARHDAATRVLLTSFSSATTRAIRAMGYPGPTGLGRDESLFAVLAPRAVLQRFPLRGQRLQVPVRQGPLRADRRALVTKLHALGIAIDYWVVNEHTEAARLLALGADGIVTDDPRAMAELFDSSPHTAGWRARHANAALSASPPTHAMGLR